MASLKLTRKINISRVESLLEQVHALPSQDLEIYDNLQGASIGGEAALLQLLFCWASLNPNGQLNLKFSSQDEDFAHQLDKLSHRAFGFVGLLMAHDVLSSDGISCREAGYQACNARVSEILSSTDIEESLEKAVYGHRTFLPCVDHSSKSKITPFYYSNGKFRDRIDFRTLTEQLLERRSDSFAKSNKEILEGLGSVIFELMHNTHDWARTDLENCPLKKSIRGVLFTRFTFPVSGISNAAGDNLAITQYMQSLAARSQDSNLRFVEISVFDCGPGLAARWLSRPISKDVTLSEEYEACLACLGKHTSTSDESYRGLGLYDVMQTLNQLSAYIRIRSGRVAMERDFISLPTSDSEKAEGPKLPLALEHVERIKGLAMASGTLITILFPIR